jgi:peptidoglycan/LPS O-acetylase OafA/YrhL
MRRHALPRAVLVSIAVATAGWWLIGDLSEPGPDLSHEYDLPDLPPAGTAAAGLTGVVVAALVGRTLVQDRRTRRPALVLAALGVVVAWGARLTTAGVHGANIGAGMVLLASPVIAAVGVTQAVRLHRATRRVIPDGPSPSSPRGRSGAPAPTRSSPGASGSTSEGTG